ncbi:hypothetical protein SAMN05216386_1655 [Nitrosospira briensis]|uniref:Uncharacterized protein n=1 Tax=Nitrosospira briensis TaxID=35799 RepID=A0A1I5B4B5_9PROT|nr:hypothetical protein [Nitrosospira briensis]SFN69450.1 hypothetical protein SAMN05216386_1655 [Nitrosospira briensis]
MNKKTNLALAPVQSLPAKSIQGREDLSFAARDERDLLRMWHVPHDPKAYWSDGVEIGRQHFSEVVALADVNEYQAFVTLELVFNEPGWRTHGWGIECGFSKAVAEAAIVGLRAIRAGATPYDSDLEFQRLVVEDPDL